jgi:hypothetical protein
VLGIWYVWGRGKVHGVLMGNLKERDHLECLGVDDRILLNTDFEETVGWVWTGLVWFRKGKSGGLL